MGGRALEELGGEPFLDRVEPLGQAGRPLLDRRDHPTERILRRSVTGLSRRTRATACGYLVSDAPKRR